MLVQAGVSSTYCAIATPHLITRELWRKRSLSTPSQLQMRWSLSSFKQVPGGHRRLDATPLFSEHNGRDAPSADDDYRGFSYLPREIYPRAWRDPTNKMLSHLYNDSVKSLTGKTNGILHSGLIPKNWKQASTVLIPERCRTPGTENTRPISLTSCVGKMAEHSTPYEWPRA